MTTKQNMHTRDTCRLGVTSAAIAIAMLASMTAYSDSPNNVEGLLAQKHCDACHDVTATRIGPPFLAVALRHRSNSELMVEVLARKIVFGGGGSWGAIPMVPNEHVTLEEARAMAAWILSLKSTG
jgi:cytochrome c